MRKILTVAVAAMTVSLVVAGVAGASNGHDEHPVKHHKTYHPPVVVPPVVVPPHVDPPTVPPVVVLPPVPQRNTILFCVQTSNRGWSTVEAEPDAFNINGAWYKLFVSKASVLVAGHILSLTGLEAWEPGNGVVIASNGVNGCDGRNPYSGVAVIK